MSETHAQDELKPCPFCGGTAELAGSHIPGEYATRIKCTGCGTEKLGRDEWYEDTAREKAIAAWNTRAALQADPEYLSGMPSGYRLVPEYPTDVMMQAGLYQSSADAEWADVFQSYVDMVRMAPEPSIASPAPEYLSGQEAVLRDALKPFAAEADRIDPNGPDPTVGDSCEVWQIGSFPINQSKITYGNLRAARRALATPDLKAGKATK